MAGTRLSVSDLEEVLLNSRHVFERLNGARLFVTGGTGFWGRWMIESLAYAVERLGLDIRMLLLARNRESFLADNTAQSRPAWLSILEGDVRSFKFPELDITDVIHLATPASARLNRAQPELMFDTIKTGTRRVLDFSVQAGASRFLLASSGAVYGRQPPDMSHLTEDFQDYSGNGPSVSAYAQGKRLAEELCGEYASTHDIAVKIARGFAFVGPYLPLNAHYAIGNFIRDGLRGGPIRIRGDGTPVRSYMYASDLVTWLWKILLDGRSQIPYNVGSEQAIELGLLAGQVAGAFREVPEVEIAVASEKDIAAERYVPSTRRARTELGLKIRVPLHEAISRTVTFNRQNSTDGPY
ncbi:MAG: NAD-dependent epimerase/dehydratase family protein [Halieaceae bacterium]|nr:NAD-dependent epimerase/dehydratase family protein [Halieaceae bacterium]